MIDLGDFGRLRGANTMKAIEVLIERRDRLARNVITIAQARKDKADEFTRLDAAIANQIEEVQSAVLELGIAIRALQAFTPSHDEVAPTERSYDILAGRL